MRTADRKRKNILFPKSRKYTGALHGNIGLEGERDAKRLFLLHAP